ncbi:unnamed protein product [Chilo suppressalis]|uniref:Uncharacterized protein n=1 Tax=Chilo suppressalis TaxID=168631 RepID=A0ABN8B5Z4_CHISP|nr:unnamed protein product [Chilo suppressalis]
MCLHNTHKHIELTRVPEWLRTVADAMSTHLREQGRALVTDTHRNAIAFVQACVYTTHKHIQLTRVPEGLRNVADAVSAHLREQCLH